MGAVAAIAVIIATLAAVGMLTWWYLDIPSEAPPQLVVMRPPAVARAAPERQPPMPMDVTELAFASPGSNMTLSSNASRSDGPEKDVRHPTSMDFSKVRSVSDKPLVDRSLSTAIADYNVKSGGSFGQGIQFDEGSRHQEDRSWKEVRKAPAHREKEGKGLHPIFDARYNIRECVMNMVLLEQHLNAPFKRCNDCIKKHQLAILAYSEEALGLNGSPETHQMALEINLYMQGFTRAFKGGVDYKTLAKRLRLLRKKYMDVAYDMDV